VSPAPRPPDPIDAILALDLGGRGIASFFQPGAAVAAAHALAGAERVIIVTGFNVPPGLPETDGPPGAAVLGRALRLLGADVRYVTDRAPADPLAAALQALDEPAEVDVYPDLPGAARLILERETPTHLISIERPGRCRSGDYLSARGESIAKWNLPLDDLFLVAHALRAKKKAAVTTLAIGDGGNEIGMGSVRARIARAGKLMARIASVVAVDHLVVAGTSNWGAYGVVAALERLRGRLLLHTGAIERQLIARCVDAGAVDGITRKREPTVDGLGAEIHAGIVELLHAAALPRRGASPPFRRSSRA
jgi:D-glutamate cyclase